MAAFEWTGTIDGDADKIGNYAVGGSPASALPTAGDTLSIPETTNHITQGTILAGMVTTGFNTSIAGGTFHGDVTILGGTSVYDAVFHGPVTGNGIDILSGSFNNTVSVTGAVDGGTFNGPVTISEGAHAQNATFNAPVTMTGGGWIYHCTFNDDLMFEDYNIGDLGLLHRISFDGGATWLYSPSSPAVAPASKVLAGNSNLGTAGTLVIPPRRLAVGETICF